jgi:hypothetical protein
MVMHPQEEMMEHLQKQLRVVNRALLDKVKMEPCAACGRLATEDVPNTPDHIETRGAGGDDVPENVWSLCFLCHVLKGTGIGKLIKKFPHCKGLLEQKGRFDVLERLERV